MQNTCSQSGNDSTWFLKKKIIFQNWYVALETPSRPPPFMPNTILNFHFDYWHPSLTVTPCLKLVLPQVICFLWGLWFFLGFCLVKCSACGPKILVFCGKSCAELRDNLPPSFKEKSAKCDFSFSLLKIWLYCFMFAQLFTAYTHSIRRGVKNGYFTTVRLTVRRGGGSPPRCWP